MRNINDINNATWTLERLTYAKNWWKSHLGFGHFNEELYDRIQRIRHNSEEELQILNTYINERKNKQR